MRWLPASTRSGLLASLFGVAALAFLSGPASADAPGVGDPAPAFSLPGSDGHTHALSEHLGKRGVVLAWFPKAFTPG